MIDITKIELFSRLDPKILRKLSDACIMRPFTKNETIVRQGEMGLGLYLIAKGSVRVENEKGGQRKLLRDTNWAQGRFSGRCHCSTTSRVRRP